MMQNKESFRSLKRDSLGRFKVASRILLMPCPSNLPKTVFEQLLFHYHSRNHPCNPLKSVTNNPLSIPLKLSFKVYSRKLLEEQVILLYYSKEFSESQIWTPGIKWSCQVFKKCSQALLLLGETRYSLQDLHKLFV